MQLIPTLLEALKGAKSEGERLKLLDQLYRGVVPDEKRVEEVTFRMGMVASLPQDLGGGTYSVQPGGAVPTDAKVHFLVDVSKQAYLYIFQTTPQGEISVLFPHPKIGTSNPLPATTGARIPPNGAFRVNDKDIGNEKVYVVVSHKPVQNLDAALAKVNSGKVSTLSQDQVLQQVATVAPPSSGGEGCKTRALELDSSSDGCSRHRGLELDDGGDGNVMGVPAGMQIRTDPGDDLIVTVFPFEHLNASDYQAKGTGTRGIVIEE
jgi:hypothetical protein